MREAAGALHGASARLECDGIGAMSRPERRTDIERRRRIDELLGRVSAAREEIVEAGLDAVHEDRADDAPERGGRFARSPGTSKPAGSGAPRRTRADD